jgi:hypothetical protein
MNQPEVPSLMLDVVLPTTGLQRCVQGYEAAVTSLTCGRVAPYET